MHENHETPAPLEQDQFGEMKPLVRPDAVCQPILGECPSTSFVPEIMAAPEESLLPSGD